jgi:hypothetical protein
MVTWDQVMAFARTLPATELGDPATQSQPGVRFRRATIAWLREDGETMVVKTSFEDREILMREDPETFFITPHYKTFPGVLVRLDTVDFDHLCDLITDAWRARATKRQLKELDR